MITFTYPMFLFLAATVIILAVYMGFRRRPAATVSSVKAFKNAALHRKFRLNACETASIAALCLLCLALARPKTPAGSRMIRSAGVDIILAVDMSDSMSCIDRPQGLSDRDFVNAVRSGSVSSRLQSAKNEIRRFIDARPNDRIGLIGFADLAYTFVPPTLDHALLLERLQSLKPGELGNATGIASPIGSGVKHLKNSPSPRRVLVLFTDGANTAENIISPQRAAEAAKELNVILHTVGIGSEESYAVNKFGQIIKAVSMPDNKLLEELAAISGGNFYTANDEKGMREVMENINKLEKTDHSAPKYETYREFAPVLAGIAAFILAAGIAIQSTGRIRLP